MEVILLCGGKSRRMGRDKAALRLENTSFVQRIVKNLSQAYPVVLAVGERGPYVTRPACPQIPDNFPGEGPLAGIEAAMGRSEADSFFVAACDMPLVTASLARFLEERLPEEADAAIPVDGEGRRHPLAGVYRKTARPVITAALRNGERRAGQVLERLKVCYVDASGDEALERQLLNVNTPEDYRRLTGLYCTARGIPVFGVAAWSGTGKTTFLEQLIPALKRGGLRVAAVKHDAHDFDVDREGKDSWRLTRAGADVTGLVSGTKAVRMENRPVEIRAFLDGIQDVDVILTEGCKDAPWPKILLHRSGTGKPPALDPSSCLAVASDVELSGAKRRFALDGAAEVSAFLLEKMGGNL